MSVYFTKLLSLFGHSSYSMASFFSPGLSYQPIMSAHMQWLYEQLLFNMKIHRCPVRCYDGG